MQRYPKDLGAAGRKLWRGIAGEYKLRADEVRVLEDACRIADTIGLLEAGAADQPLVVKGSTGQPVLHPLLAEQRTHRIALAASLRQLKLPDADGGVLTNQQCEAAQTRWARAHGQELAHGEDRTTVGRKATETTETTGDEIVEPIRKTTLAT